MPDPTHMQLRKRSCPRCGSPESARLGGFQCGSYYDGTDASRPFTLAEGCEIIRAMRPVVEAAERWRGYGAHYDAGYDETAKLAVTKNMGDALTWTQATESLAFAVDAYREATRGS